MRLGKLSNFHIQGHAGSYEQDWDSDPRTYGSKAHVLNYISLSS